ncbi:hypothetical protein BpHYR1_043409 [Brachionus plicatilis]|uniref:Uncharacterized protein n=1 Tax=Brachionus plicatilis TaxID=10195 RepID=A0A3M7SNT8_BRAPC|nr:hypothetical protein BpHYR1_043409 [Brachionus plicatilis]
MLGLENLPFDISFDDVSIPTISSFSSEEIKALSNETPFAFNSHKINQCCYMTTTSQCSFSCFTTTDPCYIV